LLSTESSGNTVVLCSTIYTGCYKRERKDSRMFGPFQERKKESTRLMATYRLLASIKTLD
jgi:hypothetical protein